MVDLAEIQVAYYMVAATGVLVAVVYYILTLRSTNKSRQAQLYMQLFQLVHDEKTMRNWGELIHMEWSDYDDFERKYGSDNNLDNYAKRQNIWWLYDGIGFLYKQKLISPEMVYQIGHTPFVWQWKKFEEIIRRQREFYNLTEIYQYWEYLAKEMEKMKEEHGYSPEPPKTFSSYVKAKA